MFQDKVWGIAYRIEDENRDMVVRQLDFREKNGYKKVKLIFYPIDLVANTKGTPFDLVIYLGEKNNEHYAGEAELEVMAQQIVEACGPSGTNKVPISYHIYFLFLSFGTQ